MLEHYIPKQSRLANRTLLPLPARKPFSILSFGSHLEFLSRDGASHGWVGQLLGNAL